MDFLFFSHPFRRWRAQTRSPFTFRAEMSFNWLIDSFDLFYARELHPRDTVLSLSLSFFPSSSSWKSFAISFWSMRNHRIIIQNTWGCVSDDRRRFSRLKSLASDCDLLKEKKRKEWNGMEDCFPTECSIGYCFAVDAGNCSRSSAAIFLFIFTTTATATAVEIPGVTYEFPHYHFPSFSSLQWEKKNNVFFFSFFLVFFLCLSFRVTLMLSGWDMGIT